MVQLNNWVAKRFRFDNSWKLEVNCKEVVEEGWRKSAPMEFSIRVEGYVSRLRNWAKNHHAEFRK